MVLKQLIVLREQVADSAFRDWMGHWLIDAEARNLRQKTILGYYENLIRIFEYADAQGIQPDQLTSLHIKQGILTKRKVNSPQTINTRLRHFRAFFNVLVAEGVLPASPMDGVRNGREPKLNKPVVAPEAITRVLKYLSRKQTFCSTRNRTLILMLWECMLRVAEVVQLTEDSLLWDQHLVQVLGKGQKHRYVPLTGKIRKTIFHYLSQRKRLPGTALFCDLQGRPLEPNNIRVNVLARLDKIAKCHLHPHKIRRSAATWWVKQPGANVAHLQRLLGHESLSTTQKYIGLQPEDLLEAYKRTAPSNSLDF
jgi:integrase/recombinase XerC